MYERITLTEEEREARKYRGGSEWSSKGMSPSSLRTLTTPNSSTTFASCSNTSFDPKNGCQIKALIIFQRLRQLAATTSTTIMTLVG